MFARHTYTSSITNKFHVNSSQDIHAMNSSGENSIYSQSAMEWTPENIRLLRKHVGDSQDRFAQRLGLKRRFTIIDWEVGRRNPSGMAQRLLDVIANDTGFTDRVAARLQEKLKRGE